MTRASDVASFLSGVGPADQPTTLGAGVTFYDGGDLKVGGALTVTGNFVVNGTQTIINTETLEVEDKLIGIASVTSPSDVTADGAGIKIYGTTEKSITWRDSDDTWVFVGGGVTATAFYGDGSNLQGVVSGVGISTLGGSVGTEITTLVFRGSGISTVTAAAGIATINVEGGAIGFNKINYIFN